MPRSVQDALIALSLSNLCFLSAWPLVFSPSIHSYYYSSGSTGLAPATSLLLDILLLAALLWFWVALTRYSRKRGLIEVTRWAFLLALIIPVNGIRDPLKSSWLDALTARWWLAFLVVAFAGVVLVLVYRHRSRVTRYAAAAVLVLSPLLLVNLAYAFWLHFRHAPGPASFQSKTPPPIENPRGPNSTPVIWIVFDELDQRLTFIDRPVGLELPELDRLRGQALHAENAYSPTGETLSSMPALTTGKLVPLAVPARPDELNLTLMDQSVVGWSTQTNVFSQAREEGFTTGVVGWYHPYCRIMGNSLDWCRFEPLVAELDPTVGSFTTARSMLLWTRFAFYRIPLAFRLMPEDWKGESTIRKYHREEYLSLMGSAREAFQHKLNLLLVHLPIPHAPWIYDRQKAAFSSALGNTYTDNLALTDRSLGELRREIEATGRWDNSVVLMTSDHWFRQSESVSGRRDHRIPFLLKLAGQKTGVEFATPFNTILTRDLLLELLEGTLHSPADVARWIDQLHSYAESPVTQGLP